MTVGNTEIVGLGGHLVVTVLASYSDDPSLNPAEAYSFFCKYCLKRTKINKKEAVVWPIRKNAEIVRVRMYPRLATLTSPLEPKRTPQWKQKF